MDVDQFFSFGPSAPFETRQVFTNREEHIRTCLRRFAAHGERSFTTGELLDFQRAASNIITVVGEGGIGKSTLARHVAELAVEGELNDLPRRGARTVLDFADAGNSSFEALLLRLRASLGPLAKSWPAFDVALAVYWERKHPGEDLAAFLKRGSASDSFGMAEQVSGTVDQLLGGFGAVSVAYRALNMLGRTAAQKARLKRLRGELPALDPILGEDDPDRMIGYMPVLLAADLERARSRRPALAVCVLDTLENVQSLPAERGGLEDLVSRLVYLMPNVVFVAASRLPLRWHDPVKAAALTYGGARRWPGLGGADQLGLGGFDRVSAESYLDARLMVDGRPAIGPGIRERIIVGSGGSPLYLDLSAGLFGQHLARGEAPPAEAFGLGFPELVLRTMRDLSADDRDLLRAAALLEAFDEETLSEVLPNVRRRQVEAFTRRPFVRRDETVWPPYRLHENLRHSVTESDAHTDDGWTGAERAENAERAIGYLTRVALEVWDEGDDHPLPPGVRSQRSVAAFLLGLRAADEHRLLPGALGDMAYSLSVLGHWQVLASLPELPGSPRLAELTAVARLTARGDLNAEDRYQAMRELVGEPSGPFADYYRHELAARAHIIGRLSEAGDYVSAITPDDSLIGASARFDLADNALRRSDFRAVARLMAGGSDSGPDKVRTADMLGHTYLQNARFDEAAGLFESTLEEARKANAPLWEARAVRHLLLALMWYDPRRTLSLIPQARDLNTSVGELIGVAQCDMAEAMARALGGERERADELLRAASRRLDELGATRELLPVETLRVLLLAAEGRTAEAADVARGLDDRCLPVWIPVTRQWAGLESDFGGIPWLDDQDTARRRWEGPLSRLRAPVCGRLDVGDRLALIQTGRVAGGQLEPVIRAGLASPAFDGPEGPVPEDGVIAGPRTVLKVRRRMHERLGTLRHFEELRAAAGVRAPRLLDCGTVGDAWWAVLERLPGVPGDEPTPGRQRELGRQLRLWHARPPGDGLRLDSPGALGVLLGSARKTVPHAYEAIGELFDAACAGLPMTAIHGDVAVGHNTLFDGGTLTGVIDPGATETGPPMLDLAWALAVDMPRGAEPGPLIEGYGAEAVDRDALDALLPLMMLRRLIDTPGLGLAASDGAWITAWLRDRRPGLLTLAR
ncbi:phosphotransferase [Actinomadura luteofluorescens]